MRRRADIWAKAYGPASATAPTLYPIIGFANTAGNNPVLRYYLPDGTWANITSSINYDSWYTFRMEIKDTIVKYYGYNFADPALPAAEQDFVHTDYDIYWDNIGGITNIHNVTVDSWHTSVQQAGYDAACNWFGSATAPTVVAAAVSEPGYTAQVPSQFGGSNPGGANDITGLEAYRIAPASFANAGTETGNAYTASGCTNITFPVMNITRNKGYYNIQPAISDAGTLSGDTITVAAGTYQEELIVNKPLTLLGPNAGINPNTGTRVPEAVIVPVTPGGIAALRIVDVKASNITIDGFTVDGDNPAVTSGFQGTNGADIDAYEGIAAYTDNVNNLKAAIDAASPGDSLTAAAWEYHEDVNIHKAGLRLVGAGADVTLIKGLYAGSGHTVAITQNNVWVEGFTVTRDFGTDTASWFASTKGQGIGLGNNVSGTTINKMILKGNRNGFYGQNAPNTTITNSLIEDNRTGIHFGRDVSGSVIKNNIIRNNFTHGILFNADFGAEVVVTNMQIAENAIYGNWYSAQPTVTAANPGEPGYTVQVPSQFGGTNPGGAIDVTGLGATLIAPVSYAVTASCGKTNLSRTGVINALQVANATQYEFRIATLTNTLIKTITSATNTIALNDTVFVPGASFHVTVRSMAGGVYGNYGAICTIGIANPHTAIDAAFCGQANIFGVDSVSAVPVANATAYEFRILSLAGSVITTVVSADNHLALSPSVFVPGTPRRVSVRVAIAGVYGSYGDSCVVGLAKTTTSLDLVSCGRQNYLITDQITVATLPVADDYQLSFYNAATNAFVSTIASAPSGSVAVSSVSGLVKGTTDNQPLNLKVNNLNAGFISRPTDENTALGVEAGSGFMVTDGNPSSAAANTAIGYRALRDNASGTENVAVGRGSLTVNLHNWNTAVGTWSLNTNKNGDGNTAVGANALTYLEDDFAGPTLGGNYNTAIGYNSLQNITAGSNNTALGAYADAADNVSNTTAIGANAYVSIDDAVVLGAAGVKVGIGTSAPRAELDVPGTGAIIVPVGDDSSRPATPVQGMIRFNTSTGHFEGYTGTVWAQVAASTESLAGIGIAGDYTTSSESVYIGPGDYVINGNWNIYAKNVWISPDANISGTGTISFYNPVDAGGTAGATLIDGNNRLQALDINLVIQNNSGAALTQIVKDGTLTGWADNTAASSLYIGKDLNLAVSGAHVALGSAAGDLTFDSDATISGYAADRFVVTNNSVESHLVKESYTGTFVFPVGIAPGDYTPATIDNTAANAFSVSVQDYAASASLEGNTENGIGRTWNIFAANASGNSVLTLQHNTGSEQVQFNRNSNFITQYGPVAPNMTGDGATNTSYSYWQSNQVPVGAKVGITRMRIRGGDRAVIRPAMACNATGSAFGEAEDYLVNVRYPLCSGPVNAGTANVTDTATCRGYTVDLSDTTHEKQLSLISWLWEQSTDGGLSWTDVPNSANKDTLNKVPVSNNTSFRLKMICYNTGDASYSNPVQVRINKPYECYCYSQSDGGKTDSSDIGAVVIGTMVNSSGGPHISNPDAIRRRTSYTKIPNIVLSANGRYRLSVYHTMPVANHSDARVSVFIDYNNNLTPDRPGHESVCGYSR
ncbi:hypothetical protein OSTOST_03711 [Ostertagia ostertagi]